MDDLESNGFALADIVLSAQQCAHIASSLPAVAGAARGGVRNLIGHPTVVALLSHARLGSYVWSMIGRDLVAVKATLFDKTCEANWRAQWHQDRTITVKERLQVAGFGPWSTKAGSLHVEAPHEVLAQMLAVRIHLDACGPDNGPLRAIPGSHRLGKLADEQIERVVAEGKSTELHVPQGGLLLMRPLLLHASSAALVPDHRRVLHIELAPIEAISPLKWHEAIGLHRAA
ncbi:MAG TPA: phytanoyl-CoA dioxygenase family protein [Thermoanaerobaculia bacterium]